jgi:hypothetical protein
MSLKAFHLIFVTLLTRCRSAARRGRFKRQAVFGACGNRRRHFGHRLRDLFFEETEKRELPMKSRSAKPWLGSPRRRVARAVAAVCLRRVLRQIRFTAGQRHELGHLHPAGRGADRADVHRAVFVHVVRGEKQIETAENNRPPKNPPKV